MVAFHEVYSSTQFVELQEKLKLNEFVQPKTAQIESAKIIPPTTDLIVQAVSAQLEQDSTIQPVAGQIVQFLAAQLPVSLNLTTLTNHIKLLFTVKMNLNLSSLHQLKK